MDDELLEKFKYLYALFKTLNDSICYNWNEGKQNCYQNKLSEIIDNEFINIFNNLDKDYIESL